MCRPCALASFSLAMRPEGKSTARVIRHEGGRTLDWSDGLDEDLEGMDRSLFASLSAYWLHPPSASLSTSLALACALEGTSGKDGKWVWRGGHSKRLLTPPRVRASAFASQNKTEMSGK